MICFVKYVSNFDKGFNLTEFLYEIRKSSSAIITQEGVIDKPKKYPYVYGIFDSGARKL